MSKTLNNPILVLNKQWIPIRIESVKAVITKAFVGAARLLDDETFVPYTWTDWFEKFALDVKDDLELFDYNFIQASSYNIRVPEIAVLTNYSKIPQTSIKLTRRNLLIRDKWKCQYSGKKVTTKSATIDHIIPKSRGGKTVWTNVVISDFDINVKKGSRTPKEAGLTLRSEPKAPYWHPLFSYVVSHRPKSWDKFINTDQWNEIGYWDVELIT